MAGILNVTPDSFYDGGRYRTAEAILLRAQEIVAQGADMIDIGAASSRPGAVLPPPEEEAAQLAEAVSLVREAMPEVLISVDTCYALPARKAVEAGADIVNDIGGGDTDKEMFATVAEMQVPYILMHGGKEHLGGIKRMADGDPVDEVVKFFSSRLDTLYRLGVKDVFDPTVSDFTPMVADNSEGYYVSKMEHDARVRIDEDGAEAAAVTIVLAEGTSFPKDEITFTLDRPFLFVIRQNDGIPLFVGVVENPQPASAS